jgi:hypothetical protein
MIGVISAQVFDLDQESVHAINDRKERFDRDSPVQKQQVS